MQHTTFSDGRPITVCNQDHNLFPWFPTLSYLLEQLPRKQFKRKQFNLFPCICKFYVIMLYSNSIQTRNKRKYVFSFSICSNPFVKSCYHYHFHHFSSKSILGIGFGVVTVWTQLLFATVRFESRLRSINCVIY